LPTLTVDRCCEQIPIHEWSHIAVSYDGTNRAHFIHSSEVEAQACGDGGDLVITQADFRIGHRTTNYGPSLGHSNFVGDIDVSTATV